MHAAFARTPHHGVDMMVIAKACRLAGIDELHIGTVVGKMEGGAHEVVNYHRAISQKVYEPLDPEDGGHQWYLPQDWGGMLPVMSVNSGGLHPRHMVELNAIFGPDTVTTMGGGIHAHGTLDGAWGARLAAEAAARGYSLTDVAQDYDGVTRAIGFKYIRPADEAMPIIQRLLGAEDWKALAFSEGAGEDK
jgi:ribulose-bisphosphate carboxylase large chain